MTTTLIQSSSARSPVDAAVEVHGLTKQFKGKTVVEGVDLRVPRGSAFGYLGPNGAGKTTLIRMLLGLTRPSAGAIWLLGQSMPAGRTEALARVGAMVEEPRFHLYLTGRESLAILAAAREPAAHERIPAAMERVGLAARADDRVGTYSQGMRQRLGIAACLLADPELLILDEPTNGLDPAGIIEMRQLIRALVDEGRTVVLSSHLLGEVEKICDMAAIVDRGRILAQGTLAELAAQSRASLLVACDDLAAAGPLLAGLPIVAAVETGVDREWRVVLTDGTSAENGAAAVSQALLAAGLAIHRIEPEHPSLEQRFLEITGPRETAQ